MKRRHGILPVFLLLLVLFFTTSALAGSTGPDGKKVYTVYLTGPVDLGRADLIESTVALAIKEEAALILVVIDSPGGTWSETNTILVALNKAHEKGIPTVAWTKGNAWSAAAIVAIACDRIYMNRASAMGAAAPIFQTQEGIKEAGEKFVSAFRTAARSNAERTGRSGAMAEAMVDKDTEVYEVRVKGETRFITGVEWRDLQERSYREGFDAVVERTVIEKGKLLSITAEQAVDYGFANGLATSLDQVLEAEGMTGAVVTDFDINWSQDLANFLTLPLISMLLLVLGIGGIYVEVKMPGFGFPGILGICSLLLFFFGKYAMGLAEIYEIILFFTGVVLILVEVFITPGFGVPGIAGIALMLAGLFLSSQDFVVPAKPEQWIVLQNNLLYTVLSLGGTVVFLVLLGTVLPRSPFFKRLALKAPITESAQTGSAAVKVDEKLMAASGTAETHLRPAGKGRFGDRILDVVTDGDFLEKGETIRIREVEGNRIVVASTDPGPREAQEEERA